MPQWELARHKLFHHQTQNYLSVLVVAAGLMGESQKVELSFCCGQLAPPITFGVSEKVISQLALVLLSHLLQASISMVLELVSMTLSGQENLTTISPRVVL